MKLPCQNIKCGKPLIIKEFLPEIMDVRNIIVQKKCGWCGQENEINTRNHFALMSEYAKKCHQIQTDYNVRVEAWIEQGSEETPSVNEGVCHALTRHWLKLEKRQDYLTFEILYPTWSDGALVANTISPSLIQKQKRYEDVFTEHREKMEVFNKLDQTNMNMIDKTDNMIGRGIYNVKNLDKTKDLKNQTFTLGPRVTFQELKKEKEMLTQKWEQQKKISNDMYWDKPVEEADGVRLHYKQGTTIRKPSDFAELIAQAPTIAKKEIETNEILTFFLMIPKHVMGLSITIDGRYRFMDANSGVWVAGTQPNDFLSAYYKNTYGQYFGIEMEIDYMPAEVI